MKNRFLILLAAVAVAAIAACEKEDTSEWGKSEALVRKYGDFDGSAIPAFVTRGVLIAEKEIGLENRRVYYGPSTDSYDDDLCGIKSPSQYVFFESGIEWSCRSFPDLWTAPCILGNTTRPLAHSVCGMRADTSGSSS